MSYFETAEYLIYNFLRILIVCGYGPVFMPKKDISKTAKFAFIVVFFAVNSGIYLFLSVPLLTVISNLVFLALYTFFYNGKFYMKLFYIATTISLAIIYEDYLYSTIVVAPLPFTAYAQHISYVLSNLLLFLTLIFLRKLFLSTENEKSVDSTSEKEVFKIQVRYKTMMILAFLCILLAALFFPLNSIFTVYGTMVFILLLVLVLFIIYFFYEINRTYKRMFEAQIIENENLFYKNQLEVIKETDKKINGINHDFKNHIEAIKYALAKGDIDGCTAYLNELSENITLDKTIVNSGNTAVDSLINYKLRDYEKMNIKANINIAIPEAVFVSDYDFNIILGNLLDNALNAAKKSKQREIRIEIKYAFDSLFIKVENTYAGKIIEKDGKLLTTNEDKKNHGYGIGNVETIAKRYNGEMDIKITEDVFSAVVVLNKS